MTKIIFSFLAFFTLAFSSTTMASSFEIKDQKAFEQLVHDYIMDNPEVIIQAVDKYKSNEAQRQQDKTAQAVKDNLKSLTAKSLPSIGNPDADVTVVEFFDYNCGYCKKAFPDLVNLVKSDKNVRVVFQDFPILSEDSKTAALWALAAHKQGKYFEFHQAIMKHRGPKNEANLLKIAREIGLDEVKLQKDAESKAIAKQLDKNYQIAREIGITGTPAFIVDDQFYGGYIGHAGLKQAIAAARK